jgi:hypothetical protein
MNPAFGVLSSVLMTATVDDLGDSEAGCHDAVV